LRARVPVRYPILSTQLSPYVLPPRRTWGLLYVWTDWPPVL